MNILMFAPAFAPNMGSESLVTSKLVLSLRRAGHSVDVVSRSEPHLYSSEWEAPWTELREVTEQLVPPCVTGMRRMARLARDASYLRYPISGLRWARLAEVHGAQAAGVKHYDVILSRSPPDVGHLPALVLSRRLRIPWIANWNDPPLGSWPEPYTNGSFAEQFVHGRLVRAVFEEASACTFPSERLARHIIRHLGIAPSGLTATIPHCSLPDELGGARGKPDPEFRLCHAGKLSYERNARAFLLGVGIFLKRENLRIGDARITLIGPAPGGITAMSAEAGVEGLVSSTGAIGYPAAIMEITRSSVAVLLEAPCEEGIFLPGKVVDYSQTGRPILAISPSVGTMADMFARYGGGIVGSAETPESVASAISVLYEGWQRGTLDRSFGSERLHQAFRSSTVNDQYRQLFKEMGI